MKQVARNNTHSRNVTSAIRRVAAAATILTLSACQTVDLGLPGDMAGKTEAAPTCAVSSGDYKVLSYLLKGDNAEKATRIIEVLKKKYAAAPPVDGANPIESAIAFIQAKPDNSPVEIEAMAANSCTK